MYIFERKKKKLQTLTEGIVKVPDEIIDTIYREILRTLYLYKKTTMGSLIKDKLKHYTYSSYVTIDKLNKDFVFSFYKDDFNEFDKYDKLPEENEIILAINEDINEVTFEFLKPNIIIFYPNSKDFGMFDDEETLEIMWGQVKHELIHYIRYHMNPTEKEEDSYYDDRKSYLMSKVEYESLISDHIENFKNRYKRFVNKENKTEILNKFIRNSEFFNNYKKDYPKLYNKAILKFSSEIDKIINYPLSKETKVKFNKLKE